MKRYPMLKDVEAFDNYTLLLTFGENEKRLYDFSQNLNHAYYAPLKDLHRFKTASVTDGEIEWITGQDFCPHTLYENSDIVKI